MIRRPPHETRDHLAAPGSDDRFRQALRRAPPLFSVLESFIASGGGINVGRMGNMRYAAVAADTRLTWTVLHQHSGESLLELLKRLDQTLRYCLESGVSFSEQM